MKLTHDQKIPQKDFSFKESNEFLPSNLFASGSFIISIGFSITVVIIHVLKHTFGY